MPAAVVIVTPPTNYKWIQFMTQMKALWNNNLYITDTAVASDQKKEKKKRVIEV